MTRDNLLRAIDLLHQHHSRQAMRPRHFSKSNHCCGSRQKLLSMSVGPTDRKRQFRDPVIAPGGHPPGKIRTRPLRPMLIEGNDCCAISDRIEQNPAFLDPRLRGGQSPLQFDLTDDNRPGEPFCIIVEQRATRGVAQPTDGSNHDSHGWDYSLLTMAISGLGVSRGLAFPHNGGLKPPHFFDRIKIADLGAEEMDHDIAAIDQHPVALWQPLDRHPEG